MANIDEDKPFEAFKVPHNVSETESGNNEMGCDPEMVTSDCVEEKGDILPNPNIKIPTTTTTKSRIDVPLPYKEPTWSGVPPSSYSFEIIKNGIVVETYSINSSLVVFGRLDVCNIIFEHPSVSRYHAIVQYCQGDATHAQGFYLYDLGSTHGTFLNKEKITPKIYYKLKVGYILKFGGSTRLHIFQGPEEQETEEKPKPSKVEEEICTWGIGEDAEEEEDLSENPFALSTPNEELYLEDPKKTLRGWFEREGYELEYKVEEKGFKTFACRIELPIDTPTGDFMSIEASVSGKKKEAVIACSLEACRTLDRLGLLRQSHQESRQKKKKKWEENDYYDSDEDTFLDRTGTIEKKREMRKKTEKKTEAETFQTIESKLKTVTDEINEITNKLSVCEKDIQQEKHGEDDTLDAFMSSLSDTKGMALASDKIERRKLKYKLLEAEKEKAHLEKLLEIVRPTKLPPAVKYPGMIGKRLKTKFQSIPRPKETELLKLKLNEDEEEIEEDSDSESTNCTKTSEIVETSVLHSSNAMSVQNKNNDETETTKTYGLILNINKKHKEIPTSSQNQTVTNDKVKSTNSKEFRKPEIEKVKTDEEKMEDYTLPKKRRKGNRKQAEQRSDVYTTGNAEYATWVPPVDQTGDGMTHLNAKYGY